MINLKNDITETAIGLIKFLNTKQFKSFIIGKVANLILLNKTQRDFTNEITGIILTSATNEELYNIFTQYRQCNGHYLLHFGKYDFITISTNDINKYRKHLPTVMDTLMYDGNDFIDHKNAMQFTLDGILSINDELSPYVFNYIINQKAIYNYKIDVNAISEMSLNKDYFQSVPPVHFLDKPYGLETMQFLCDYELLDCNKYKTHYEKLMRYKDVVKKMLKKNCTALEIYYLLLRTDKGLNKFQKFQYQWIKEHYNLLNLTGRQFRTEVINCIFNNEIILEQGMPLLRQLIEKLYNIRKLKKDVQFREEDVIYDMCCRPLFPKQLHITDNQLNEIYGKYDLDLKKNILLHITSLDEYPTQGLYEYLKNKPS